MKKMNRVPSLASNAHAKVLFVDLRRENKNGVKGREEGFLFPRQQEGIEWNELGWFL